MQWDYGARSISKLDTCHEELVEVFHIYRQKQFYEITIIHGWRGEEIQHQAFIEGNSTKDWPDSKHNHIDQATHKAQSLAVDFAPWCRLPNGKMGVPWKDTHAFAIVGGILLAIAKDLGYNLRYGGDWDMDGQTTDQTLMDWGHIERR
jgi:hypothetical protein